MPLQFNAALEILARIIRQKKGKLKKDYQTAWMGKSFKGDECGKGHGDSRS